ncbi:MAG TPA: PD-(D/E)XK nuclease family protein [Clostridium sp.]|uniref:RecB family exonuclease n=1 Tax=Clostridium sp. TaxID=1506 RepID=UPI002F91CDB6
MQNKTLFISNTSINMFKNCKKKFKYKYIDKINITPIKSHYLSFGTSLHNTLAELNKLNIELQTYESSIPILEKHWISEGYESDEDELSYFLQAKEMLENYCADRKDLGRIIFSEEMIKHYLSKNLTLCGKIDKVYVNENEKIEILDFKTGNSFIPFIDLREDIQLPIYLLLLKYKLGVFPSIISYYYISINQKVSLEVTKEVIDYSLLQLKNIISEINLETQYPFTPTTRCNRFCEYFTSCEFYKGIT